MENSYSKKIHMICNAHIDPIWQWDWQEGVSAVLSTFQSAVNLAEKYDYTFVDLFTPLFDINIGEVYSDYTTDGAHFTSKGYEVVTSVVKPVIDSLLVLN